MDSHVSQDVLTSKEDMKNKKENKRMRKKILKNVFIISLAFLFLFTSYSSMANLQSSINPDIGTNSLSIVYATMVISCFFLPTLVIKTLKEKKTMAISMLGYLAYIAAQFYPRNYTLYPAAALVGLGAATLWSAKCTYLTSVARKYADLTNSDPEVIVTRFFGIFFMFFQSSNIWGNIISSTVLSMDPYKVSPNDTERLVQCGANYCPGNTNDSVSLESEVTNAERYIMSSVYFVSACLASLIIAIFVDPLSTFHGDSVKDETSTEPLKGKKILIATFFHMGNPFQLLIIPLTMFSGLEQAFLGADLTASYIACGLGVYMVGYVLIFYGLCDAVFSVSFSPLVKTIGRVPIFTLGAVINASLISVFLTWMPNPDQLYVFFLLAGFWGIADAVWQTQINAFYGILFPNASEAAFSNYRLWESMGFIIAYVCNSLICTDIKIYILIAFLSLGLTGYYTIEILMYLNIVPKDENQNVKSIFDIIKSKK